MTNNNTQFQTTLDHFSKDVLVVPARDAWPIYKKHGIHAYICQVGRVFKHGKYIAFYEQNKVHSIVPFILGQQDKVLFERGKYQGALGKLVDLAIGKCERPDWPYPWKWSHEQVFLLSAPDAAETVKLAQDVINDQMSKNGTRTAFVQCQRYVSLEALRRAKKTSDLCDK